MPRKRIPAGLSLQWYLAETSSVRIAGVLLVFALLFGVLVLGLVASPGHAQVFGPFTMQLAPFCNVITFTAAAQGPIFNLSGNCGAATGLSASGNAFFNANGTVGGGLSIIAAGQAASQVALTINPGGPSGTWSDNTGNSGTLVFGVTIASGAPRPISVVSAGGCPPDSVRVGRCVSTSTRRACGRCRRGASRSSRRSRRGR